MAGTFIIKNLAELDEGQVRQAVEIYAANFSQPLSFISTELDVLADALQHSFQRTHYYVGLLNGNVVSIAAYSTRWERSHQFQRKELVRALGLINGYRAYLRLHRELECPLDIQDHQCYLESVATDSAYRGKGFSYKIQNYLFDILPFEEFLLEVDDSNYQAVQLYEKMGFSIYHRKTMRSNDRQKGSVERLYLRKTTPKTMIAK
ncbi:MAG: GNAT family N-acetyltransferase [Sphaerochaetaceae bacterium]